MNRVENENEPKRPQSGGRLGSFWFSTRPTAMGGTDYKAIEIWGKLRRSSSNCPIIQVHYNQCPIAVGRVENQNEPKLAVWVRIGFQLSLRQ